VPMFLLPIAAPANQAPPSNPLTWHFNPGMDPSGPSRGIGQGIEMGMSSAPGVEEDILSGVASYGKQLGRIEEALAVLLDHFAPTRDLLPAERSALADVRAMFREIDEKKACSLAKLA